jgi:hypothetical protein
MTRLPAKRSVRVWGKEYEVKVHQESKTVWQASGRYEGEWVDVKGTSESTALRNWEEAATYRGS